MWGGGQKDGGGGRGREGVRRRKEGRGRVGWEWGEGREGRGEWGERGRFPAVLLYQRSMLSHKAFIFIGNFRM